MVLPSSPTLHAAVGDRQDHLSSPVCCRVGLPCGDCGHVPGTWGSARSRVLTVYQLMWGACIRVCNIMLLAALAA